MFVSGLFINRTFIDWNVCIECRAVRRLYTVGDGTPVNFGRAARRNRFLCTCP